MSQTRDRQYWDQVVEALFLESRGGKYLDAVAATAERYPEFVEFLERDGAAMARSDCAQRLKAHFRELDLHEGEFPNPTPPHLRAQFLPFNIEMPPMSPMLNAHDGTGRIASSDATPKQHKRHHSALYRTYSQAAAYRQKAAGGWSGMIDQLRELGLDQPENLTLAEIIERLRHRQTDTESHPDAPAAPPL